MMSFCLSAFNEGGILTPDTGMLWIPHLLNVQKVLILQLWLQAKMSSFNKWRRYCRGRSRYAWMLLGIKSSVNKMFKRGLDDS